MTEETTIKGPEEAPLQNNNSKNNINGKKNSRNPRGPRRKPNNGANGNVTGAATNENEKEPLNETNNNNSNGIENKKNGKNSRRPPRKSQPKNKKTTASNDTKTVDTSNETVTKEPDPSSVVVPLVDEKLPTNVKPDPRNHNNNKRITKKAVQRGTGRNTESFDPASTLVRPDVRVWVGSNTIRTFDKKLKHDDVVIVPELFGKEDDWTIYYKLIEEVTALQQQQQQDEEEKKNNKPSKKKASSSLEWIPWHEGAHLIVKDPPQQSKTFTEIVDRLCEYFNIRKESIGLRFNWYRDGKDWKPFHHDSAAFNAQRAKNQNITVGVSFGSMRELAFLRATTDDSTSEEKCRLYFPQPNNGVFSFGRDVNIKWKHGINALKDDEQDGKGRISIVLWGLAGDVIEEEGSPPLLGSDGTGPHATVEKKMGKRRSNPRNKNGRVGKNKTKMTKALETAPSKAEHAAEPTINVAMSKPDISTTP